MEKGRHANYPGGPLVFRRSSDDCIENAFALGANYLPGPEVATPGQLRCFPRPPCPISGGTSAAVGYIAGCQLSAYAGSRLPPQSLPDVSTTIAPFGWMGQGCTTRRRRITATRLWRVAFHGNEEGNMGTNFEPKMRQ